MPTPRTHGGAALAMIPMTLPGFKGLNTQQASGILGPEWATKLENVVFDANSRVAARNGWATQMIPPTAARFVHLAEIVKSDSTTALIALDATLDVYQYSLNDGVLWNGTTSSINMTDAHKSSVISFNNYGWVFTYSTSGVTGIRWNPAAPTVDTSVSDANAPRSGNVVAAFGRLWGADNDGHTLRYSALLDGTNWSTADSGVLDMWNVWPQNDEITAIASFNGSLVVFGRRTIVMWTDGQGSRLGMDPTQMYVVDVIQGTGCISRHSVQHVDGDLWFLSEFGLQSLGRVIQEKSNPINNLSQNVQNEFNAAVAATNPLYIRSAYSPLDKVYLLSLPSGGSAETGTCYVFDTNGRLEDGSVRSLGTWTLIPTAVCVRRNGTMYMARNDNNGVGVYSGSTDQGATYSFTYESGWMDLTQQGYMLLPKRLSGVFFSDADIDVTFKWAFDFNTTFRTQVKTFVVPSASLWGTAIWGTDFYGGGVSLREGKVAGSGSGQYVKVGITAPITGTTFAVQSLNLFAKIGRYK